MGRPPRILDGHYRTDEEVVSVWLGTFPDRETYEQYFRQDWENTDPDDLPTCQFWKDLGIRWFDHDFEEGSGYIGEPVPVTELLGRDWSYMECFRAPLIAACRVKGIESANILVMLYEFDYPAEAGFTNPHMTFVGVFPYSSED
jgi:hypothetical protein